MGRRKQLSRPSQSRPAARKAATIPDLKREPERIYYLKGNAIFSSPRRGQPGSTQHEADIPDFEPRAGFMYYLKGNDVMETPLARR